MARRNPGGLTFRAPGAQGSGFAGLRSEIQRDTYRRLAWLAGLVVALAVVRLAATLLIAGPGALAGPPLVAIGLVLLVSILALWVFRTCALPAEWFPTCALAFEIAVAVGFGTIILNWQNLLDDSGWPLGTIPGVAVWLIVFASVVPLTPAQHLVGAGLSALSLFVWFFASLSLYEVPATVGPEQNFRVFQQLLIPTGVAVGVAYAIAARLYTLSRDLSDARRIGSYQLTDKLGAGGMGEVWQARHQLLARPAAIKLIRPDGTPAAAGSLETRMRRFEQEVQATANLRSPHTIEVYDYGTADDGTFYYVMELLEGVDLQVLVERWGPQPPGRVVHVLRQVCHSLGEAHDAGMVHRDIKPANIYLCRYGRDTDMVKVLDFGMVKQTVTDAEEAGALLTQVGVFAGTPAYASPEQAQGLVDQIDARSDIYAVGCVGFWLLTGRRVFEGDNPMQILARHLTEPPESPSVHAPGPVPPELDRLILDCLEKQPDKRVASADDLNARLALVPSERWSPASARAWWDQHRSSA